MVAHPVCDYFSYNFGQMALDGWLVHCLENQAVVVPRQNWTSGKIELSHSCAALDINSV